ncbi:MAG: response regulator [bacterium]
MEKMNAEERALIGKGKILLMDDEKHVRDTISRMLTRIGYEVYCVKDGAEAIEIYQLAQEIGEPFDVVILDLNVPGGMGGTQTMETLIDMDPKVKAILSSSDTYAPAMTDFRQYGFSGILPKPYNVVELSKAVNKLMTESTEKLTVLLATRDNLLKEKVLEILNEKDYPVVVVNSCRNAIQYMLDYEFDLVIFDPDLRELDGLGTIQLIKRYRPKVPIVVTSDHTSYETGVKIARVGVYFRMGKPIDEQITKELIQSVEKKIKKNSRNS